MKYTVEILQDTDFASEANPRDWDNLGTMICLHPRYNLGDRHYFTSPEELCEHLAEPEVLLALPLFLYNHSGLAMSTSRQGYPFSCPWDCGQVGYIFADRQDVLNWFSRPNRPKRQRVTKALLAKAEKALVGEVEQYNLWLGGEVYWYKITDEAGEVVDSCGGFLGYEFCEEEAKRQVRWLEKGAK